MRTKPNRAKQGAFLRAVGTVVRARRQTLGLTVAGLADLIGGSHNAVSRLEAGTRNLSVLQLSVIASALDLSLAELLKRAERHMDLSARKRIRPT